MKQHTPSTTQTATPSVAPREAHQRADFFATTEENDMDQLHDTPDEMQSDNIRLILEAEKGRKRYLSTSQQIMVGLALCQPNMLKNAGYPNPRDAWNRLDDEQRAATANFCKFQF